MEHKLDILWSAHLLEDVLQPKQTPPLIPGHVMAALTKSTHLNPSALCSNDAHTN
jgi:hypothetical protein